MKQKMYFMNKDSVSTEIEYDRDSRIVEFVNHTSNPLHCAFGVKKHANWDDLEDFISSRVFPRERFGKNHILAALGLSSYNSWDIIKKNHGAQLDDYSWVKFDGEVLTYERDIDPKRYSR